MPEEPSLTYSDLQIIKDQRDKAVEDAGHYEMALFTARAEIEKLAALIVEKDEALKHRWVKFYRARIQQHGAGCELPRLSRYENCSCPLITEWREYKGLEAWIREHEKRRDDIEAALALTHPAVDRLRKETP